MATNQRPALQKRISSFGKSLDSKSVKASQPKETKRSVQAASKEKTPSHVSSKTEGAGKQPTYSKEAEEKFDAVLEGNLDDVPPMPRSTVRIFLSSTFSDMRAERNALTREAYPKLREFCAELGLSFQVVDLRWGVTAEATNNHLTTRICLLELENCKKLSLGPSCITLIGNRYGFCPLPYYISVEEFDILKTELQEIGRDGREILETWYRKDDNALPSAYYIQPINSLLPHFLDNSPDEESSKQADAAAWAEIEAKLLSLIHEAARSAAEKGKLSDERKQFYVMSVTEHETRNGITEAENPNKHALGFIRGFTGLDESRYEESMARRNIELIEQDGKLKVDEVVEKALNDAKKNLSSVLNGTNIKSYSVPWQSGGVDPQSNSDHNKYIQQFCSDFVSGVEKLIQSDLQAKESLIHTKEYYSSYEEILHHAHFCKMKCETFCGQSDVLEKIKSYILDASNRKPFVLYAQSGAGKTSVMASAMKNLKSWINGEYIGIIRFLGTSTFSTDIYNVLFGVCGQLADNTDSIMEPQSYKTMKGLVSYVPRFLRSMSSISKCPIVIFLDSLDQLNDVYAAYNVKWLPLSLPPNVKIVLSTLPEENRILDNLKALLPQPENFVELPLLPYDTSKEIVEKYMTGKQRTLTESQVEFLLKTFKNSPSPLYLKLLMDQAMTWTSSLSVSSLALPESVSVAINSLFEQLEIKFGSKFVEGALGLITVGLNGLSEIEIEDGVSCLDSALMEIYKYHDPPVPGIVRVPPVLWARIRYDIQEYLVERQSQGRKTLFWYHRQFIKVATQRYTQGERGSILHKTLFELFAAETGVQRDITLPHRKNLHIPNANRDTTPQPISWENSRKLMCLTYHLKHCLFVVNLDWAKQMTYCNLYFIRAKVASSGLDKLVKDMEEFLEEKKDSEIACVLKFVNTNRKSLQDIVSCSFGILAFIGESPGQPNLTYLRAQAKECLLNQSKKVLIPSYACLAPRKGEPEKVFNGLSQVHCQSNDFLLLTNNLGQAESSSSTNILACLDMSSSYLIKTDCKEISCDPFLSSDGKFIFALADSHKMLVKINISSGEQDEIQLTEVFPKFKKNISHVHISQSNSLISGSSDSKLLAISIGHYVTVLGANQLKSISEFEIMSEMSITNLHCCSSPFYIVVTEKTPVCQNTEDQGRLVFGNSKGINSCQNLKFEVLRGASKMTMNDEFHICYGHTDKRSWMVLSRGRLAEMYEPISVDGIVKDLKVSPMSQILIVQLGDFEISFFDADSKTFLKKLSGNDEILSWDIDWDEEELVVSDTQDTFSCYNTDCFSVLASRKGHFGNVKDLKVFQESIMILTSEDKVMIWDKKEFFSLASPSAIDTVNGNEVQMLENQKDITTFSFSLDNNELITVGWEKICRVWSLENLGLVREFSVGLAASNVYTAIDNKVIVFDQNAGKVVVFTANDGKVFCDSLPEKIMCLTLTKSRKTVYLATNEKKPVLYEYDVKSNSSSKKCIININFHCVSAKMMLTSSETYVVFLMENTQKEYEAIAAMWKSGGRFPEQRHPYRFVALHLSQGKGVPLTAFHQLSKIPHLGVTMERLSGNIMMLSSRRWVMFWDIPTGRCDQTLSKQTRLTKMYRPLWVGEKCVGNNNVVCISPNKEHVAVGSEDGYLILYGGESGMPVGMKAPCARHPSPVNLACFSSSGSLVASACTGGHLKLWEAKTGTCLFSVDVGTELGEICFSRNGTKLLAVTAAERSHFLVFDVN